MERKRKAIMIETCFEWTLFDICAHEPVDENQSLKSIGSGRVESPFSGLRVHFDGDLKLQSKLDVLRNLSPFNIEERLAFLRCAERLIHDFPEVAKCKYFFDNYVDEYLLYRVLWYGPSLSLVQNIYDAYPEALSQQNHLDKSPLHRACQYHAPCEVIHFLVGLCPDALRSKPSPLFLAIHPETKPGVIDLLVTAYPEALMTRSDGLFSAFDCAIMEGSNLPLSVIRTMVQNYPDATMSISTMSGSRPVDADVASILACSHRTVRCLDVSKIKFSTAGMSSFLHTLANNKTLETLIMDLSGVSKSNEELSEAIKLMLSNNRAVSKLVFKNGIQEEGLAKAFVRGFAVNVGVADLTMESFASTSMLPLLDAATSKKELTRLALPRCVFNGDANWDSLALLTNLVEIDLSSCEGGPAMGPPLTRLVQSTRRLRVLNVAGNEIQSDGCSSMASALKHNKSVEEMDVRGNGQVDWTPLVDLLCEANYILRRFHHDKTQETPHLEYFTALNMAGRASIIHTTTKKDFVGLVDKTDRTDVAFGLLRHAPHIWPR